MYFSSDHKFFFCRYELNEYLRVSTATFILPEHLQNPIGTTEIAIEAKGVAEHGKEINTHFFFSEPCLTPSLLVPS